MKKEEQKPSHDPLTEEELGRLRVLLREREHEAWLRGRIKVIWPWVLAILAAVVGFADWFTKHFSVKS